MSATAKSAATKRKTLLFKFKDDTLTTVSHETFSEVARTLGFNETQTLYFAVARLRDEILRTERAGPGDREEPYPPLTAGQLLDIRSRAPRPRGRLVRKASLFDNEWFAPSPNRRFGDHPKRGKLNIADDNLKRCLSSAISELRKAARPKAVDMTARSPGRKKTIP